MAGPCGHLAQQQARAPFLARQPRAIGLSHLCYGGGSRTCSSSSSRSRGSTVVSGALPGFGKKAGSSATGKSAPCPCGSGKKYQECCQKFHQGRLAVTAGDPEAVLRARYSAWVKREVKYLRRTCHPDNPALKGSDTDPATGVIKHCSFEEDVLTTLQAVRFEKLQLLRSYADPAEPGSKACVDYTCTFKRLIDSSGQKLKPPPVESVSETGVFVKDEDKGWLLLATSPLLAVISDE